MDGKTTQPNISFLTGGGEMGQLIRAKDWNKTSIGHPNSWPQSLRTTLSIILNSKFPMFLFWGPELLCFYNDAYRPSLGNNGKHPDILGSRAKDYWQEIWGDIKPLIDHILAGGEANWSEDQLLPIYRNGKMEDVYWTFSYSAVNDETGKPAGVFVTCTETTNKVKALKNLEESAERFQTLADNISQLAWMADEKGSLYWYNQRWYDFTGTTFEEMQDWGWQKVHHPDYVDRVSKKVQHSWDTGEVWEDTFPLRGQDGQYRWFLSRAIPIRDDEGKVIRWFGTNTDITEQKTLIEKLNETVNKLNLYEKVVVNIKEAVMITEAEPFNLPGPRILYVNEAFYEMTGFTPEEVIGKTPRILQGPKTDRKELDKIRKALENWQPVRVELVNYKKDGTEFFVEFEIVPVANEKGWFTHWVSVQRKVSERKIAEQQIRESQELVRKTKEQLELTFANVPAAIFLYNHKKEILFANEKAAHLLGYNTVEELLKVKSYDVLMKRAGENYYVTSEKSEPFTREQLPSANALKGGKSGEVVFSMERKSGGEKIWLLNKSAPIFDGNGKVSMVLTTSTDITAQKTAEGKIRNSENRFRNLADNSPMWIWIADENVNLNYANTELLKFVGVNDYTEITGHLWEKLVHPDDIGLIFDHFSQASTLKKPFDFECRVKNAATGLYEWFYLKGIPQLEGNIFMGFIGTGINIQEQKQQLETIRESEANFRTLAETLPQLVWVTDENGNQLYASKKWNEYSGKVIMNLESWKYIVHPDDFDNINEIWAHCLATGDIYKCDVRLRNKNDEYRWFTVNGEPVMNNENKIIKWVGAFTDVHAEKSFAEELKKQVEERTNELQNVNQILLQKNELLTISENFNRTLTEVSPTMVYIHDIEKNRPVFLNSTYLKFIGYSWEQVEELGDKFFDLVIHPDDILSISEITAKIKASKPGDVFESNSHRKNTEGVWVPFLNRLTAFKRNSKNEVTQIIGVAIDISELKQAKDVLQQKNIDLENMNNELQSFAYVSSHDLQEPLRKIQTFATRIVEKEYQNLSENGRNYFNRMQSAAARMQQLIQDLLAFSRVNSTERVFENMDLKQIVEDVKEELKEELQQKNAVVEANNLGHVQVIPFQFRQLMHNLIGNSLKFSKTEIDPRIHISSERGKGIKFNNSKLNPEQNYCHITVKDNGIGFQKEYNDRVFEVFQRLHGKDEYSGTGIGLAIVKKIVENHNGIITAQGEVDKGVTFDIFIPSN